MITVMLSLNDSSVSDVLPYISNARENKLAQQRHLMMLIAENPDNIDRLLNSVTAKNENGKVKSLSTSKNKTLQTNHDHVSIGKTMASAISEKTVLTKKKKAAPVQTKQISIGKKNASTISETAVVAKTKPTSLKTDDVYVRNTSAIFETNVVTKRITPSKMKK